MKPKHFFIFSVSAFAMSLILGCVSIAHTHNWFGVSMSRGTWLIVGMLSSYFLVVGFFGLFLWFASARYVNRKAECSLTLKVTFNGIQASKGERDTFIGAGFSDKQELIALPDKFSRAVKHAVTSLLPDVTRPLDKAHVSVTVDPKITVSDGQLMLLKTISRQLLGDPVFD